MKMFIVFSIVYSISIFGLNIRATETVCGRRLVGHIEGLIRDGFTTHPGDFPWHAAIFVSNDGVDYTCGGTLINHNSVLTAGHCVFQDDGLMVGPDRFLVGMGMYDLRNDQRKYKVLKVTPHAEYSVARYNNDIAMLRLATAVHFTNYIQPICLWNKEQQNLSNVVNQIGTVIGWGITESGEISQTIKAANIPVLSHEQCQNSDPAFFNDLTPGNFCGGYKNGTTICQGDSGSSLSFLDNDIYRIRGIVSYYKRNERYYGCNPREFVVFTDVAKYLHWIESVIGETTVSEGIRTNQQAIPPAGELFPQQIPNRLPWPQIKPPTFPQIELPMFPQINLPTLPQIDLPTLPQIKLPTLPQIRSPTLPQIRSPTLPQIRSPTLPQMILPNTLPWSEEPLPPKVRLPRKPYTFYYSTNSQQGNTYNVKTQATYNEGNVFAFASQQSGSRTSKSQQNIYYGSQK